MKKWYVIASILVVMLLATSCFAIGRTPPPAGELKVLSHSMTRGDSGSVEVRITVENTGSSVIELAQVKVGFYDAKGNLIDSSSDGVMNLRPGETWDFEITCPGAGCDKVERYAIETLAGTSSGGL